jgi:TolB-like protein/class 3 adenylate cyclase
MALDSEGETRKLAAIMFTDVKDFSKKMGENEIAAMEILKVHDHIMRDVVAKYGGVVIKSLGDSLMVDFPSAVNAVRCAIEAQERFWKYNTNKPEFEKIQIRIGIHLGDVINLGNDIYGDGVNIAARIEAITEPNRICVSAEIYNQVKNKMPVRAYNMGVIDLKNIAEPVEVYQLLLDSIPELSEPSESAQHILTHGQLETISSQEQEEARRVEAARQRFTEGRSKRKRVLLYSAVAVTGLVIFIVAFFFLRPSGSGTAESVRSIAVLPLKNISGDTQQDYFVDGLHEELITDLAKIKALRVISRTSTIQYKGTQKSMPAIARELDVDALIEGSVLRVGDQIRITTQLIHGPTDKHLWAKSYDRDVRNVLSLLSEVAQAVAGEVEVVLSKGEREVLANRRPVSVEAHGLYLKGRYEFNKLTRDGFDNAIAYFEESVAVDSNFGAAYAAMGMASTVVAALMWKPVDQCIPQAKVAIAKALALDDGLGEAHAALGTIKLFFDWDWLAAEREIKRALELEPNDATTRHAYADYLAIMGDVNASLNQMVIARRYDPLSAVARVTLCGHLLYAQQYDSCIAECRRWLEVNPETRTIRSFLASAFWCKGLYGEWLAESRKVAAGDEEYIQALDRGYQASGSKGAVREAARVLAARHLKNPASGRMLSIAGLYSRAGVKDSAFVWLEAAFRERLPGLLHVPIEPVYDNIRSDPRYKALLRKIGLPG